MPGEKTKYYQRLCQHTWNWTAGKCSWWFWQGRQERAASSSVKVEPLFLSPVSWAFHSSGRHSLCFLSPAPYVKVYLLDNGVCIAKKKTKVARKTLEPLYQQLLSFEESPQGKVLQVCTPCWPLTLESTFLQPDLRFSVLPIRFFSVPHGWDPVHWRQWPGLWSCLLLVSLQGSSLRHASLG